MFFDAASFNAALTGSSGMHTSSPSSSVISCGGTGVRESLDKFALVFEFVPEPIAVGTELAAAA